MNAFYLVGNWKMHPLSLNNAETLFNSYKRLAKKFSRRKISLIACPSTPHLGILSQAKRPRNLFLGSQDVFYEKEGAFTGEVSPVAVYGVGADYTILGHSERRSMGETNDIVSKKIKMALKAGLEPIVCVGEDYRDHEGEFWHKLRGQIEDTLADISKKDIAKIMIAYEPVWAIGKTSSGAMQASDLHETVLFIKKVISQMYWGNVAKKLRIFYGGSVFPGNAEKLFEEGNIDGFLVGRESLNPKDIEKILTEITG